MEESRRVIVFDDGSWNTKIGFGGESAPQYIFRTVVGAPKKNTALSPRDSREQCVGDKAISQRGTLNLRYPIRDRVIMNWDDMERVWHHSFYNVLKVDPSEHPLFLTEPLLNPASTRVRIAKTMYDTFDVPELFIAPPATLAMFAARQTTGIVIDCGHTVTTCTPVCEGIAQPHSTISGKLGGADVTNYLLKLLTKRGYKFETSADKEFVRDLKERACHVALDYQLALEQFNENTDLKRFNGPNGEDIILGSEMFRCTEILFKPSLVKAETYSVHEQLYASIMKCDKDMRDDLYQNIVITGGSTLFPGFVERFQEEIKRLLFLPNERKAHSRRLRAFKIIAPDNRNVTIWQGASVYSTLELFQEKCITRDEFAKDGPVLLKRSFP